MGRSLLRINSRCRIPVRTERASSPPMKHSVCTTPSGHHRQRSQSPPSPPSIRKSHSGRYNYSNYKQPSTRSTHASETSYLPPRGTNNRHISSSYEKNFGPLSNNEAEDRNSMFRRSEYDGSIARSERLAGSYRILDAARNTPPIKGCNYGVVKSWDNGLTSDSYNKETGNPLVRSQLPPPSQAPVVSATSSSRRNLARSEDLDRILTKYGKTSRPKLNSDKDPDFASVVRTDTTFRMTSCKVDVTPGPGIHAYWGEDEQNQQQRKQQENDILLKLNNAIRCRPDPVEDLGEELVERTPVQQYGPDGPGTAPTHPMENEMKLYHVMQDKSEHQVLRRSTHVFPFKETPSGHLVIDPVQIAFESRKISVLVSDPNNNAVNTVELTTTKYGANDVPFHTVGSFTNKNERILHEVKKAMSLQETHENSTKGTDSLPKLLFHQQDVANPKKYSDSTKATEEFEENLLERVVSGRNADTHIVIGDKIFPCHSLVLELFSTYFDRLSRPPEAIQRVHLPEAEVTPAAFPILVDWIVQSEDGRREILTKENLVSVYAAAKHLGMKDLELQCITFLERKVDATDPDLLTIWEDVKRRQSTCPELVRIIGGKMAASYHCIYTSKRYLQMEVDELFMLLNSDDISIDSEMDVYDSAVTWLLQDWKNRKVHVNKIMSTVRFGLLSPLQLTQINLCPEINKVKNEKDYNQIFTYGTVKSMIDDGLAFSILDESYKTQPEELKKWVDKTGVKAPSLRTCLVNRKRASPLILEKISLLEDASQTKLRANFNKLPEKSSSYTLLDSTSPKPETPFIENLGASSSGNTAIAASSVGNCTSSSMDKRGKSKIPKAPGVGSVDAVNSGGFTCVQSNSLSSSMYYTDHGSGMVVQELSKPKLLSNSSNTLQQAEAETERPITRLVTDAVDRYPDRYEQFTNISIK